VPCAFPCLLRGAVQVAESLRAIGVSPDITAVIYLPLPHSLVSPMQQICFCERVRFMWDLIISGSVRSVFDTIGVPSFVRNSWVTAEFVFPTSFYLNSHSG